MNDLLLLARLWAAGATGATPSALHKDLDPIVARARATSKHDAASLVTRSIDEAIAKGLVHQDVGKRSTKLLLTDAGKARAQAAFPDTKGKSFSALAKTWLVAHALGIAAAIEPAAVNGLSKVTTLRLVVLSQHFRLGLPVVPAAKALDAALTWHAMRQGITDSVHEWAKRRPLTLDTITGALVASAGDVAPAPKKHEVYARLAAKLVDARNAKDLHDALVARLVGMVAAAGDAAPPTAPDFAAKVLAAGARSPTGKLDASLVLINHAHRQYVADHPEDALSLTAFKEQLWAAALAGRLMLASADMPQTLDAEDYRASRIDRGASIFALVRLPPSSGSP